jgi:hypothetical protein
LALPFPLPFALELNFEGVLGADAEASSRLHRSALNGDVRFPRGEPEFRPSLPVAAVPFDVPVLC